MGKVRMCIVCHVKPATVPDRNQMGRPIKRVCADCHRARLAEDLKRILMVSKPRG